MNRRGLLRAACAALMLTGGRIALAAEKRWYEAAAAMKRLAESWGDQPYGAVLVAGDAIIGEGPSRVVQKNDPSAHAEREAIRDAQRRLGRNDLRAACSIRLRGRARFVRAQRPKPVSSG